MGFRRFLPSVIGLTVVILFAVACGMPEIIEHPRPRLDSLATIVRTDWKSGDHCLREEGGFFRECVRVGVNLDGAYLLISTQEELMDLFAPIESPEEALSYALLATGYSAKYDPEDYRLGVAVPDCDPGPERYRYYTDFLEDTHVVEIENGYEVYLFESQTFGCAPHPVWSVPVVVTYDGTVIIQPKVKLFEEGWRGPTCCID